MIDFIFPCHPKDFPSLKIAVDGVKNNVSCCNRIFVVSKENPNIEGVIHFNERAYYKYITKEKVEEIWSEKNPSLSYRSKWVYQQFIKLLSGKVIPDLTDSFVLVDADTIFLRDVPFDIEKFYYCRAKEYHKPYLEPIKKLFGIEKTIGFSTICHHMIFNKEKLNDMISDIENRFDSSFVDAILGVLDYNQGSCMSEWDIYANYMILNHPEMCKNRQLEWHDIYIVPNEKHVEELKNHFDFVSCHAYMRGIE